MATGIHYHKTSGLYAAVVWRNRKRVHVGYYKTEFEATIGQAAYLKAIKDPDIDYNLIANDPDAWMHKAKEIIKQLSQRSEASKI